jgi:hypothetical protein
LHAFLDQLDFAGRCRPRDELLARFKLVPRRRRIVSGYVLDLIEIEDRERAGDDPLRTILAVLRFLFVLDDILHAVRRFSAAPDTAERCAVR